MLPLAVLLASLVGLSLGLLGGGGSILTTPILHYVLGVREKQAIAMSFPIVGLTSLVGAVRHHRAGNVDVRTALGFGAVSFAASYAAGRLAQHVPGVFQIALLAVMMLVAATFMYRGAPGRGREARAMSDQVAARHPLRPSVLLVAIGVGSITGVVGIGGGFLFVPALVLLDGLPMRTAVGTSTLVIALNTLGGFLAYRGGIDMRWDVVAMFTAVAIAGIVVGTRLTARVSQATLRRVFALFLLVVGAMILADKSLKMLHARRAAAAQPAA